MLEEVGGVVVELELFGGVDELEVDELFVLGRVGGVVDVDDVLLLLLCPGWIAGAMDIRVPLGLLDLGAFD